MSHIKHYLLETQEKAEALAMEIESRYHTLTVVWEIQDPDVIVSVLNEPIGRLLELRKELLPLGGQNEASHIRLSRKIVITVLKAKTWQAVQRWYQERGIDLDVEQEEYIAQIPSFSNLSSHLPEHN